MKRLIVAVILFGLGACSLILPRYIPQNYQVTPDNLAALRKVGPRNINVGTFTMSADFDNSCRVVAGEIGKPDSSGFEGYMQKALVAELRQAGIFDDQSPTITLTGDIEKLQMSTWRSVYISNWDLGVRLDSSNGKSVYITLHYEFNAGEKFLPDCQTIANHYMYAVQQTLNKLISAPEFESLVTP